MSRADRTLLAAVALIALAGCASIEVTTEMAGLRGFPADTHKCHPGLDSFTKAVVPRPDKIVICGVKNNHEVPVKTVTPSDGAAFEQLVAALSLPDIPTTAQCYDVAGPDRILAITPKGTWSLSVPANGCDPVRQEVKDALALAAEQPTPSNT